MFKMRADGSAFPDTFWFSIKELKEAGAQKEEVAQQIALFEDELGGAAEEGLGDWEEGEEGGEEEEDDEVEDDEP